jgi:hypothetical protein
LIRKRRKSQSVTDVYRSKREPMGVIKGKRSYEYQQIAIQDVFVLVYKDHRSQYIYGVYVPKAISMCPNL